MRIGIVSGLAGPWTLAVREIDHAQIGDRLGAEGFAASGIAQQQPGGGIVKHLPQPAGRIGGVERQIGAARLEDRQQSHHHRRTAFQADRHRLVRPGPEPDQMMRQPVGLGVERAIGDRLLFEDQCDRVGRPAHLRFEQLMHAKIRRIVRFRPVQLLQQVAALVGRHDVQLGHRLLGIGNHRPQQRQQITTLPLDRRPVEQRRRITQSPGDDLALLSQVQFQIELDLI
ncbi:hypothetical protein AJ87_00900, partial [Rhizobium yanglingense]